MAGWNLKQQTKSALSEKGKKEDVEEKGLGIITNEHDPEEELKVLRVFSEGQETSQKEGLEVCVGLAIHAAHQIQVLL